MNRHVFVMYCSALIKLFVIFYFSGSNNIGQEIWFCLKLSILGKIFSRLHFEI